MEPGQVQKYQEISKLYKEIVDAITTLEVSQVKLFLVNLEKRMVNKESPTFQEFSSLVNLLDTLKEAKGKVPLHFAVARGNLDIIRYLIETVGVDHSVKDKEGNSPFFTAIEHGHLEVARYFIEELHYSANESKEGEISTLHLAANHNHVDLLNYLISKGANLEKVSIYGKPINWAVGNRHFESTKVLLDHGADPNGDSTGSSLAPLILAVDFKDQNLYELLLSKGASPNVKDPNGYSVLHVAAEKGDLEFVKDLVGRGADVNLEVEGKTPLYLAFEHSKWEVVNFLKEKSQNYEQIEERIREEQKRKESEQPDKERAEEIKNIGNKFYAEKRYEEALQEYLKAIQHDPENVPSVLFRKSSTATSQPATCRSSSSSRRSSTANRPRRRTART
jgi:ankyrin repeat protein